MVVVVRRTGRTAAAGALVWVALAASALIGITSLTLIDLLLALAPIVAMPIGIELFARGLAERLIPLVRLTGLAAGIAMVVPKGWLAGLMALPWLIVCGLLALWAGRELVFERRGRFERLQLAGACAFLTVGAGWLVLSRLGWRPLGFSEVLVEMTAVHFHYAGFIGPLLALCVRAALLPKSPGAGRLSGTCGLANLVAMPLVAAGFLWSHPMGVVGSVLIASALVVLAITTLLNLNRLTLSAAATRLLQASSLSVLVPMVLAVQFSLGLALGTPALSIPRMALVHGVLNAFGFSLCGLLAWRTFDSIEVIP
jgi:hypothetical protein